MLLEIELQRLMWTDERVLALVTAALEELQPRSVLEPGTLPFLGRDGED